MHRSVFNFGEANVVAYVLVLTESQRFASNVFALTAVFTVKALQIFTQAKDC